MKIYMVRDEDKNIIGLFLTLERAQQELEKAKQYCRCPYIIVTTAE